MAFLELEGIAKYFGRTTAVDHISLSIKQGEFLTLLGPSGCGKTTILRMVAGFETPDEGNILLDGDDITNRLASKRPMGMVFQSYALFPHMTVLENVAYGLVVSGMKKAKAHEAARTKLMLIGLAGMDDRLPSELSGGQQQRVAVARAIVLEPRVLLFDEPLSNLDAKLRRRVRDDIRSLQRALALTVVYVTHDQEEALAVSDRIIVMANARIAQDGTPRDLYERPVNRFVADFIGDANIVAAELRRHGDRAAVTLGGVILDLPHNGSAGGMVELAIRPDALQVNPGPAGADEMEGKVIAAAYLGTRVEYRLATAIGELFAVDRQVARPLAPGSAVSVRFASTGITVIPP